MTLSPCLTCGEPSEGGRCDEHARKSSPKVSAAQRGYDAAWNRLSAKARRLQPFCTDCGATEDLQADHSEEAWARKARGQRIRLRDIDVTCGRCNRRRGAARPRQTAGRGQQTRAHATPGGYPLPAPSRTRRFRREARYTLPEGSTGELPANTLTGSANAVSA